MAENSFTPNDKDLAIGIEQKTLTSPSNPKSEIVGTSIDICGQAMSCFRCCMQVFDYLENPKFISQGEKKKETALKNWVRVSFLGSITSTVWEALDKTGVLIKKTKDPHEDKSGADKKLIEKKAKSVGVPNSEESEYFHLTEGFFVKFKTVAADLLMPANGEAYWIVEAVCREAKLKKRFFFELSRNNFICSFSEMISVCPGMGETSFIKKIEEDKITINRLKKVTKKFAFKNYCYNLKRRRTYISNVGRNCRK